MILFENFNEIHKICQKYNIRNYTINTDGSIDVDVNVLLSNKRLTKLPVKFRNVSGYFICRYNNLTTLEGAPESVGGYFNCQNNNITKLDGAPKSVDGDFYCDYNELTTLVGAPQSVGGNFYCSYNKLTTLEGSPQSVSGNFYCGYNELTTLLGSPQSVVRDFNCKNNNLTTLEGAPKSFSGIFCSGNPIYSSKYFDAYLEALQCINTDKIIPKELMTPGLMSFLKEIDNPLYNKIKTMFDQDTIDTIADLGDIGF